MILPQTGEDLFDWGHQNGMRFGFWVKKSSEYTGIDSWVVAMAALGASVIILWLDFTNLPTTICPDLFTSPPNVGLKACFSIFLALGLAALIGFVTGVLTSLKKYKGKQNKKADTSSSCEG